MAGIQTIQDLRQLDIAQCEELAAELREELVEVVSATGGHLGPSLGVVELSMALLRVFDSPDEPIIWDTGHQAYVHKMLTGRRDRLGTLRSLGGLSGYPSRAESEHDWVENSHVATSLSWAAGLAEAKRQAGEPGKVVAVIGDGALTAGIAWEALNHIAEIGANVVIVVNDNGRSYAPTVGGFSRYLSRLELSSRYQASKRTFDTAVGRLPAVGRWAKEMASRSRNAFKLFVTDRTVFEDIGLTYSGPIDGHDLALVEKDLRRARALDGPVVLHIRTNKGHGYVPAELDEVDHLHGVSAGTDPVTGRSGPAKLTWTDVFARALIDEGRRNERVVAITAAMGSSTGINAFAAEFPLRAYDVGICEQHAATFAAGLAKGGLRPVVAIYATFLNRAFDQVLMDVCLHREPVTFVLDRAGVTGPDGATHHGIWDLAWLREFPGLTVMAPRTPEDLVSMLRTSLSIAGPSVIRYPKGTTADVPARSVPEALEPGKCAVLAEGTDVALVGIGRMSNVALAAAEHLAGEGVQATVIDARFVKPLDEDLPKLCAGHRLVVTIEDNVLPGGFGSAVLELLEADGPHPPVVRLGLPDAFLQHGPDTALLAAAGLDAGGVAAAVRIALRDG